MITCLVNFLSLAIVLYDTLGYIVVYMNKEATEESKNDYNRLIYTWVFYMSFKWLTCYLACGECFISGILTVVFCVARLLIALPITGISNILRKTIIDDALLCKLISKAKGVVCCKAECAESK